MAKLKDNFTLEGKITGQDRKPLKGLIIKAYDQDAFGNSSSLGNPVRTRSDGSYEIFFTESEFKKTAKEKGGPELYIEIYLGKELLQKSSVKKNAKPKSTINLKLKKTLPNRNESERKVFGSVRNEMGDLVSNVTVEVYDRTFDEQSLLGAAQPVSGQYEIKYKQSDFLRPENTYASLLLRVYDDIGEEIFESPVYHKAPQRLELDINLTPKKRPRHSEFKELKGTVELLLGGQELKDLFKTNRQEDIRFLTNETGQSRKELLILDEAQTVAADLGVDAEVLYGMAKEGLSLNVSELLYQNNNQWDWTIERALKNEIIAQEWRPQKEAIINKLEEQRLNYIPSYIVQPQNLFGSTRRLIENKRYEGKYVRSRLNHKFRTELINLTSDLADELTLVIKAEVEKIDFQDYEDKEFVDVFQEVILPKVQLENDDQVNEIKQLLDRLNQLEPIGVSQFLQLDMQVKRNSVFSADIRLSKAQELGRVAQINDAEKLKLLVRYSDQLEINSNKILAQLLESKQITPAERKRIELVYSLTRLTDDHLLATEKIYAAQGVDDFRNLISWDRKKFGSFFENNKLRVPIGLNENQYYKALEMKIDRAFPSQVLMDRILRMVTTAEGNLKTFEHPREIEEQARNWQEELGWEFNQDGKPTDPKQVFVNIFQESGLGGSKGFEKDPINEFFSSFYSFLEGHNDLDLRTVDFFSQKKLEELGLEDPRQANLKRQLMAFQRMMHIGRTAEERLILMGNGFDSSFAIANVPRWEFFRRSGIADPAIANDMYNKTLERTTVLGNQLMRAREVTTQSRATPAMVNIPRKFTNELKDIDGYEDLFGSHNYCECEHCRSILSPAAYFVDLMRFVEDNISKPVFVANALQDSGLYLQNRRPGLWHLNLSCENTNGQLPYLVIVLEVLEQYLFNAALTALSEDEIIASDSLTRRIISKLNEAKERKLATGKLLQDIQVEEYQKLKDTVSGQIDYWNNFSNYVEKNASAQIISLEEFNSLFHQFTRSSTGQVVTPLVAFSIFLEKVQGETLKIPEDLRSFSEEVKNELLNQAEKRIDNSRSWLGARLPLDLYKKFHRQDRDEERVTFSLPFNLPLEEIRIYLKHFDLTLFDLYHDLLDPKDHRLWLEKLQLSQEEHEVLTKEDLDGIPYRFGSKVPFSVMEVSMFIRFAGLERETLDQILDIRFNKEVFSNVEVAKLRTKELFKLQYPRISEEALNQLFSRIDDQELQNFPEVLVNISGKMLDFLFRFVRLWKKSGIGVKDLDNLFVALTSPQSATRLPNDLSEIIPLAKLIHLKDRLDLNVEETCSLVHWLPVSKDYPQVVTAEEEKGLYERVFDLEQIFGKTVINGRSLFETTAPYSESKVPFLVAGLGISQTELYLLLDLIQSDRKQLDRGLISLLFRHARLAKSLGWSPYELIQALELLYPVPEDRIIDNLQKIFDLLEFANRLKNSPFSLDDLHFILLDIQGVRSDKYRLKEEVLEDLIKTLDQDPPMELEQFQSLVSEVIDQYFYGIVRIKNIFNQVLDTVGNTVDTALIDLKTLNLDIGIVQREILVPALTSLFNNLKAFIDHFSAAISVFEQRLNEAKERIESIQFQIETEILTPDELQLLQNQLQVERNELQTIKNSINDLRSDYRDGHITLNLRARTGEENEKELDQVIKIIEDEEVALRTHLGFWAEQEITLIKNLGLKRQLFIFYNIACNELSDLLKKRIEVEIRDFLGEPPEIRDNPDSWLENWLSDEYPVISNFPIELVTTINSDGIEIKENQNLKILLEHTKQFERILYLFKRFNWGEATAQYITENFKVFGIKDIREIELEDIQRLSIYGDIIRLTNDSESKMNSFLRNYYELAEFDETFLSEIWGYPKKLTDNVYQTFDKPDIFDLLTTIENLKRRLKLVSKMGINGSSLKKLLVVDYEDLVEARNIILGSFSSRYLEEQFRIEMLGPYKDQIVILKRDILCDYILALESQFGFSDKHELYAYFLLDVETGACNRTSRVLAGISSLQLYVHRVLLDLEQSANGEVNVLQMLSSGPQKIFGEVTDVQGNSIIGVNISIYGTDQGTTTDIDGNYSLNVPNLWVELVLSYPGYMEKIVPINGRKVLNLIMDSTVEEAISPPLSLKKIKQEWEWRRNYRVWEANRKVFLYPENYVLPELRKNKSGPFEELEGGLLQQQISKESARETLQNYLAQVNKLNNLRSVDGLYDLATDTYFYFGRTRLEPYEFFYRKRQKGFAWTTWKKMEIPIKGESLTSIIYRKKLFVFWVESELLESSTIENSNSKIKRITHQINICYSFLTENNQWRATQKVLFHSLVVTPSRSYPELRNQRPIMFSCVPFIRDNQIYIGYQVPSEYVAGGFFRYTKKIGKLNLFLNEFMDVSGSITPVVSQDGYLARIASIFDEWQDIV